METKYSKDTEVKREIEKVERAANALGWSCYVTEPSSSCKIFTMEFWQYSPQGEDFGFSVEFIDTESLYREIASYEHDFDPEEHAMIWIGRNGAPGLRMLLADADAIAEMLHDLVLKLEAERYEYGN